MLARVQHGPDRCGREPRRAHTTPEQPAEGHEDHQVPQEVDLLDVEAGHEPARVGRRPAQDTELHHLDHVLAEMEQLDHEEQFETHSRGPAPLDPAAQFSDHRLVPLRFLLRV